MSQDELLTVLKRHPKGTGIKTLRTELPHLSDGTIYRNLKNLGKWGSIEKIENAGTPNQYKLIDVELHDRYWLDSFKIAVNCHKYKISFERGTFEGDRFKCEFCATELILKNLMVVKHRLEAKPL